MVSALWLSGRTYLKIAIRSCWESSFNALALDLDGTQALTYGYARDTRFNDKWIYDPKSRRTRKVVDNPYEAPAMASCWRRIAGAFTATCTPTSGPT